MPMTRSVPVLVALALGGCAALPGYVAPDWRPAGDAPLRGVLFPPPEAHLYEISAGGVPEKVYDWSAQAGAALDRAVREQAERRGLAPLVAPPPLAPDEQLALDTHIAMFRRVADQVAAVRESKDASWEARAGRLEFTIGPGLAGLAQRTGTDTMLIVDGLDFVSSPGRKVASVLTTLIFILPVILPGSSYVQAGLVDLSSGRLLWFGRDYSVGRQDLRQAEAAQALVERVFAELPTLARP